MEKYIKLGKQFTQYFAVALIGFAFDFGTLVISKELFGLHYLMAAIVGFTVGLIIVYGLSERFVFSNPKISSRSVSFAVFAIIGLVGLGLLSLLMWIFTDILGIAYILSKLIATIFVYIWNFFARRSLYHN